MNEAGTAPDDAAMLAEALRRSVSSFVRAVRHGAGTVKSAQSETLELLESLGPMNVATLAERRGVTHQTMRSVVAGLETEESVQQHADPSDRRSRLVSITPEGQLVLARGRAARACHIGEAIRTLLSPADLELLQAAIPILDRLSDYPGE
jgi:DNA-binding MarR family transcriptional regulator